MRPHGNDGMSMIVQTVARWLKGPILLFGIYIAMYGHVTPGGGFGGGVIIACAFILVALATSEPVGLGLFSGNKDSGLDSVDLLSIHVAAWLVTWIAERSVEQFIATPEHAYFTLLSGGTIPIANIGLGLKVASAVFLVFSVLTALEVLELKTRGTSGAEAES